jgi:MFS family permease
VLLGSQFVFNIGFYAVVPFLAIFLRDDMLLSGGMIGLILGLRTFSQQGMFIVGGALSDRFGARSIILCGCVIRVVGYLLLALGDSIAPIILGACLTGIGGALFSPSIEALLAKAGTDSEASGKRNRAEWFALFAVCGELGAVLGPVLGSVLAGLGFRQVALAGRSVYRCAWRITFLPATSSAAPGGAAYYAMVDYLSSAAICGVHHRLQFMAVELQPAIPGSTGGDCPRRRQREGFRPLFMLASGLVILFQLPLARFARRVGAIRILPCGFLLVSASFLSVALFAASTPPDSWLRLLPAACFVTLLTMGQMLLVPSAKDMIPQFATPSMLGAHYGALATAGGIAVLAGNFLLGSQLDRALTPSTDAIYPWLQLAVFPLLSAIALFFICRSGQEKERR